MNLTRYNQESPALRHSHSLDSRYDGGNADGRGDVEIARMVVIVVVRALIMVFVMVVMVVIFVLVIVLVLVMIAVVKQ